jgi:hypothetical protein
MLLLFLGYYGSITFFNHVHVVNGVSIVHSHPFKSGPENNSPASQHSDRELQNIISLSYFLSTPLASSGSSFLQRTMMYEIPVQTNQKSPAETVGNFIYCLRAPPAC